jgi:hypothetical protein
LRRTKAIRVSVVIVSALIPAGCLDPTEIVVTVRTDVDCTDAARYKGISIYADVPGAKLEGKAEPALTTNACDPDGTIGSIVLVPSGDDDAEVGIRVVAGITTPPEQCQAEDYRGCIVARRALRYVANESLPVDVLLTSDCIGLACNQTETCVAGVCSGDLEDPAPLDTGPTVRCGDGDTACPTSGDLCCLTVDETAQTATGHCADATACAADPARPLVMACDSESDCSGRDEAGRPTVCCLQYLGQGVEIHDLDEVWGSMCLPYAACRAKDTAAAVGLCEIGEGCLDGALPCFEAGPKLPGYFMCRLAPL